MKEIKLVVIGAGSTYTPELIEGLIKRKDLLSIGEIALMDIDGGKLSVVGGLAARMIGAAGLNWKVTFHNDLKCIEGASYVMTQIRVGKLAARILDEKIPLEYGMIGQETCGIGGFFKALRTIPVIFEIADKIKELAPDAYMINFTNPSGIIAEALKYKDIKSVGLCNCPYAMEKSVKDAIGLPDAEIEYVGLNHLSWITAIRYGGKDYIQEALDSGIQSQAMKNIPANGFSAEVLATVGAIPSTYLEYYYFRQSKLEKLKSETLSRGEVCFRLEKELLQKYQDTGLSIKPPELEQRGGAYYSEVAISLMEAIHNDRKTRHIINIKNNGALSFLDDEDIIETEAVVGKNEITPLPVSDFKNGHIISMMRTMKDYEKLAVKAALSGEKKDAIRALMQNPLCGDFNAVKACYERLYELNRDYLNKRV